MKAGMTASRESACVAETGGGEKTTGEPRERDAFLWNFLSLAATHPRGIRSLNCKKKTAANNVFDLPYMSIR